MALILVIDDVSTMRELVRRMLQGTEHSVIEADDGENGLALFREQRPDVVITDLFMPRKEGIETIREIRRSSSVTKIIAMSGSETFASDLYLNAAERLGADAALAKPFSRAQLLQVIAGLLRAH
jgi:two-component system, chemotaxis family, chemotaxis protein CheY